MMLTEMEVLATVDWFIDKCETATLQEALRCSLELAKDPEFADPPKTPARTSYHNWLFARGVESGARMMRKELARRFRAVQMGISASDPEARLS